MGFLKGISGKNVEEKVDEYSEIYGEILLGMHRDLEAMHQIVEKHKEKTIQLENLFNVKIQEVKSFENELIEMKNLAINQNKSMSQLISLGEQTNLKFENHDRQVKDRLVMLESLCNKQNKRNILLSWSLSILLLVVVGGFAWIALSFNH